MLWVSRHREPLSQQVALLGGLPGLEAETRAQTAMLWVGAEAAPTARLSPALPDLTTRLPARQLWGF